MIDDGKGSFGPLRDLRPIFGLRTGVDTTVERLALELATTVVAAFVPDHLAAVLGEASGWAVNRVPAGDRFLLVNGRLPSVAPLGASLPTDVEWARTTADGDLLLACLTAASAERYRTTRSIPGSVPTERVALSLVDSPWVLLDQLPTQITADIERIARDAQALGYRAIQRGDPSRLGDATVLVHGSATIAPYVVFDASAGPIHVGPKATIRPFAVLCGPCSIGTGSTVADRSLIKAATTCGPQCRLGGEIGGTSIVGFSNKTHDGHLGDSVIGEWVNLGAGTDNSNLLNTYGEVPVRLEPDGPRQRSGRIFLGSIIGDHVKCAIGTRLMTGTVIGTGAMIAGSTPPPTTVSRFAWITDEGERRYALPKFVDVMRTVMKRRSLEPGAAYVAAIERLHAAHAGQGGGGR